MVSFDIDRALMHGADLVDFLRFCWRGRADEEHFGRSLDVIRAEAARGTDAAALSRTAFGLLAGTDLSWLCEAGRLWHEVCRDRRTRAMSVISPLIAEQRRRGNLVVLVSASFRPCLEPIAAELAVNHQILCTEPVVNEFGRLTGEILDPMVGANRLLAAWRTAQELGFAAAEYRTMSSVGEMRTVCGRALR